MFSKSHHDYSESCFGIEQIKKTLCKREHIQCQILTKSQMKSWNEEWKIIILTLWPHDMFFGKSECIHEVFVIIWWFLKISALTKLRTK